MITLEKDCLTIIIKDSNVAERWVTTMHDLLDILYCKDEDFTQKHHDVLLLLREMMPDTDQAKAMYGVKPAESN